MSLTGKSPADTYKDLLYVDNSNTGVDATSRSVKTGNGQSSSIKISDRSLTLLPSTNNTAVLDIQNASGTTKFEVDTTNNQVKALGHHVNTMYVNFGISGSISNGWATSKHYAVPFMGNNHSSTVQDDFNFGSGTDPATSFTTAAAGATNAATIVPVMWFIPDNISIDAVYSIEGADAATGDTTRMHLLSYDFTSGSTSALTNGTLLAHNDDVTNAGSEQAYLSTWTIDSASVAANKVVLAFFRSDSVNSDYSLNITVKYHLT